MAGRRRGRRARRRRHAGRRREGGGGGGKGGGRGGGGDGGDSGQRQVRHCQVDDRRLDGRLAAHARSVLRRGLSLVLMHEVHPKALGRRVEDEARRVADVVKSWLSMTQPGMRPEGVAVTEVKSVTEPKLAIAAWQSDSWVIVVSPASSHESALGFCDVKSVPNHVQPPTVANSVHVSSVVVLGAEAKQCASSPAGHAASNGPVSYRRCTWPSRRGRAAARWRRRGGRPRRSDRCWGCRDAAEP